MVTSDQLSELEKELGNIRISINTDKDICNYDYLFLWTGKRMKTVKLIKSYDINWIANQVNKFLNYSNNNLTHIFKGLGLSGNIYYTSFGFSYCTFMRSRDTFDKDILILKEALDKNGIVYRNEFSDACWVYRFIISQKEDNLSRIKKSN
jgi:hypothetical protein